MTLPAPIPEEQARPPAGHQLSEGDRLGNRYLLQRRIGTGGMSVVWRAWDEALQRQVAVKVMHAPLGALGDREMIRREARAAARIDHPDAMGVYDVGETITSGGRLTAYVVMRLLDGHSLADLLDDGPVFWRDAVEIVFRVADVLAAAHANGIVHRDVTPENVLLTDDGPKLLDFGIAARVGERDDELTSPIFGTPPYVAPERLHGAEAAGATDVYALGVLMFQILTGRTPYPETTWEELEIARRAGRPPAPTGVTGLPRRVAKLCRRCLATDPADRPTAAEIATELGAVLHGGGHRWQRTLNRVAAVTAAGIVIAAAAVIATDADLRQPGGTGAVPGEQPTPAPSTATATAPQASGSPSGAGGAAPGQPSAQPQTPPTVAQAVAALNRTLDRGAASGTIRDDVLTDLRQRIANLADSPSPDPAVRAAQLQGLHDTLRSRANAVERPITDPTLVPELDDGITALGAAIERAMAGHSPAAATSR